MKILVVITTAFTSTGGLTTVMMNYYRAMNKEGLKIVLLRLMFHHNHYLMKYMLKAVNITSCRLEKK